MNFLWPIILVELIWAANLKDPHLFPYRQYETISLLILAVGTVALILRYGHNNSKRVALALSAVVMALILINEGIFQYHKAIVLEDRFNTEQVLGGHFLVGYTDLDDLRILVTNGLVGGVFITQRNATAKSTDDLHHEISQLQSLRKTSALPPLIIATDQEGGIISRLSPPLPHQPQLSELITRSANLDIVESEAENYGMQQGKALSNIGVTVNFSPVVDLKSKRPSSDLDINSLINQRAISMNPSITTRVAQAYVRGLEKQGVHATLKHFPGLGRVKEDTHHFSAILDTTISELDTTDWLPFKSITNNSTTLIMLGHVILSDVDSDYPVSFSRKVVQTILRERWRYEGVLITDDLTMSAAYSHGLCDATVKSLNAGVDIILLAYDHEKYFDAMYCAARAYENGEIDKNILKLSRQRIDRLRAMELLAPPSAAK